MDLSSRFAAFMALFGFIVTIFWMVVGWRAMRAHEKIAYEIKRGVAAAEKMIEEIQGIGKTIRQLERIAQRLTSSNPGQASNRRS